MGINITYQITGVTTRNGSGNDASGIYNAGVSTITWTVTDACGNTSNCTTTVTISNVIPSVTITSPSTTICGNTSITFTANPTNGGTPTYQWQINSTDVTGETGSTFTSSTLADGDVVTVVMTSNAPCVTNPTATSNGITITSNNVTPGVTILPNPAVVCAGANVTFTANPTNGGVTPSYQWQVNGSNVGTNSATYSSTFNNGDIVSVVMTSNASCITTPTASDQVTVTVNPLPTVDAGTYPDVCVNAAAITLSGTPAGGTFSGPGVSGNSFDPVTAGLGIHTITYSYTDAGGCSNTATTTITVKPTATSTTGVTICSNQLPYSWNGNLYNVPVSISWYLLQCSRMRFNRNTT